MQTRRLAASFECLNSSVSITWRVMQLQCGMKIMTNAGFHSTHTYIIPWQQRCKDNHLVKALDNWIWNNFCTFVQHCASLSGHLKNFACRQFVVCQSFDSSLFSWLSCKVLKSAMKIFLCCVTAMLWKLKKIFVCRCKGC